MFKPLKKGTFRTVAGEFYGTPKELWGFRAPAKTASPQKIATEFLAANSELLGVEPSLDRLQLQRTVSSLGAQHVIFQQVYDSVAVHRAYVTVHIGRNGRVYMVKNRAVPEPFLPKKTEFLISNADAAKSAKRVLPQSKRPATVLRFEQRWFPKAARLIPTWRIRLARYEPREEWIVYVNARTGGLISRYDNLSKATGQGLVFDPSPVTALGDHEALVIERDGTHQALKPPLESYSTVTLHDLKTNGRLEGKRVTTKPTRASLRVQRSDRRFLFTSQEKGFEQVMVYHHVDAAIRYLEKLGFKGSKAIFRDPVAANVNGTREDNSWYSPDEKRLTFGTGDIDDAEDGETIVHELGHAIQDAIVPDFGQSAEAAAMGEGFGDYFAASFFADRKPARYRTTVMTWDGLLLGLEAGLNPPCLRRVDGDGTFDDFHPRGDEHDNGLIWSATLWDVREKLGSENADRLIVESHFQLDGFTTFARGARAIIDADENLNHGANRDALTKVFRKRKIGPVA